VSERIEDYALIGDCQTAALVSRRGSIDWLCLPRFDSGACFAALLGTPEHGHWSICPTVEPTHTERAYRPGTLVLDTTFHVDGGAVKLTDCMPVRYGSPHVVRILTGVRGRVRMRTELVVRFDYGSIVPWVRKDDHGIVAVAGPDSLHVSGEIPLHGEDFRTLGEVEIAEGETVAMGLTWHPSHVERPKDIDLRETVARTVDFWCEWSAQCTYEGEYREHVLRSLVTLKALTHAQTGGIVAAPTTSLPERIGGVRNWDYRFCWVRDATFTLYALVQNGFLEEARAWRAWLMRAIAGDPAKMQILYAVDGERRVPEADLPWLPGYEGSRPVRTGNAAFCQRQLDVYGEIMDALYHGHRLGLEFEPAASDLRHALLDYLASSWTEPDDGIWEIRGPQQHFTHSKVMAWVAFDRAVRRLEDRHENGNMEKWRELRDRIHAEVCAKAFDPKLGAFVQHYGSNELDASLLMMPMVGFLPASDPRVQGTLRAIEKNLVDSDGFVHRYRTESRIDGLPAGEGVFLPCSFWLADNYALAGRHEEARRLFERLLSLRNDVGLLSEEYDSRTGRMVGNFPQAFTHVSLVNSARSVCRRPANAPARLRRAP
jgi:GH15 family glucan-1,4-alpha-glucosidase